MSDTFTFVAPAMPRRRVDPFTTRLVSSGLVLAVLVAGFAAFVMRAERAADAHRATLEAQEVAHERAEADRLAAEAEAGLARQQAATTTVPAGVLTLAQGDLARTGDLSVADVAGLTQQDGGLLFVDGPSTAPTIASIAVSTGSWGAAVMGPSGTCYWVSLDDRGDTRYGHGADCTGQAALAAARSAW